MPITQEDLGRRIEFARKAADRSQGELGEAVGLSQSAISRIESGERSVDSLELSALANYLSVSVLDLLEAEPLDGELEVAAREQILQHPGAFNVALERVKELVRLDRFLAKVAVPDTPRAVYAVQKAGSGKAVQQGQRLAERIRTQLGIGGPIADMATLTEERFGLDIAIEPLLSGLDGLCVVTDGVALALVDSAAPRARQRFTIAHELCHYLLRDAKPLLVDETTRSHKIEEMRANSFAAHFLLPKGALAKYIGDRQVDDRLVVELQYVFDVSLEALAWHLSNLGFISDYHRRALIKTGPRSLATRYGYISQWEMETSLRARRPPKRLWRRAVEGYSRGVIGIDRLASLEGRDDPERLHRELEDAGIVNHPDWQDDDALV